MSFSFVRVAPRLCSRIPRRPLPLQSPRRPFYSSSSRRSSQQGFFRFLDDIPQNTVLWGIIGLNGAVFATTWWAKKKLEIERNPTLYRWIWRNFSSSWRAISEGRVWTVVTSMFMHSDRDVWHILFNGFTFYFMAPLALNILGSRQFLFLYLGGGALADLGSITFRNIWRSRDSNSCGASSAIYSVLAFLACQAPRMTLLVYGIIPVPIYLAVGGLFAYDMYQTALDKGGVTNTSGHVGGMLAGAGYFILRRFRRF